MTAADRQHRLLALARQDGRLEVSGAAVRFQVAPETIRRDLSELERRGLVRRTHGGAYPVESAGFETSLARREVLHVAEKRRIAAAAVELLGEAETVFIDEGYTPQLLPGLLPAGRRLTVVTASLATAAAVAESDDITVLLLGGRVRGRTLATVGGWATDMLATFVIDLAFIGANGISREFGLTTPDPAVAAVKAQAVQVGPAPGARGHAHEVRREQFLPVRRGRRLRDGGHRQRTVGGRGPPLRRCWDRTSCASDALPPPPARGRAAERPRRARFPCPFPVFPVPRRPPSGASRPRSRPPAIPCVPPAARSRPPSPAVRCPRPVARHPRALVRPPIAKEEDPMTTSSSPPVRRRGPSPFVRVAVPAALGGLLLSGCAGAGGSALSGGSGGHTVNVLMVTTRRWWICRN